MTPKYHIISYQGKGKIDFLIMEYESRNDMSKRNNGYVSALDDATIMRNGRGKQILETKVVNRFKSNRNYTQLLNNGFDYL